MTVHIFKLENAMVADVEEKENASPALEPQPDPKWTGGLLEPEFRLMTQFIFYWVVYRGVSITQFGSLAVS